MDKQSIVKVVDCKFQDNEATITQGFIVDWWYENDGGGGILVRSGSNLLISDTIFQNNLAASDTGHDVLVYRGAIVTIAEGATDTSLEYDYINLQEDATAFKGCPKGHHGSLKRTAPGNDLCHFDIFSPQDSCMELSEQGDIFGPTYGFPSEELCGGRPCCQPCKVRSPPSTSNARIADSVFRLITSIPQAKRRATRERQSGSLTKALMRLHSRAVVQGAAWRRRSSD